MAANFGAIMKVEPDSKTLAVNHSNYQGEQVLLATAVIRTMDKFGRQVLLRALIDSGSQGSMMTEEALAMLQFKPLASNNQINPLGGGRAFVARSLTIAIQPHFTMKYELTVEFFILRKLTKSLPDHDLNAEKWNHINGLQWADPKFHKVGPIDMLLGAEVVAEIMKSGLVKGKIGEPIAQETSLGWLISGKVDGRYKKNISCFVSTTNNNEVSLEKFWELEELNTARVMTKDEIRCEELFTTTVSRNNEGRFIIKIPYKDNELGTKRLGSSKEQAVARFKQLEKKLAKNTKLKLEYQEAMNEYINLGLVEEVTKRFQSEKKYYIPHHPVFKPDSLTTKMRVVFDASARTSTGVSYNECMFVGAKQQDDLIDILIRWRKHRIVFKSDIEKMYRQILMDEEDRKYHIILWRNEPSEKLREYQMKMVTFGIAAAPFLATRCLKQIALDEEKTCPKASPVISQDFYVDDMISGADTVDEAVEIKNQLINALGKGCMKLRKWSSNSPEFLQTLPEESTEKALQVFEDSEVSKTLGLQWNPRKDSFGFNVSWAVNEEVVTKRVLLSEASKVFDPLGWLSPVVINAKLLMQEVWTLSIKWDEKVPKEILDKWFNLRDDLPRLSEINIQRWVTWDQGANISLHGFGDASEKAYATVVYLRIEKGTMINISMIASKTRVAPKATKTTLPRLELCSAVLTGRLLNKVQESLRLGDIKKFGWLDSSIALGWIKGEPERWKTFVANRVAEIQNQNIAEWNHVKSEENPADCASRGILPNELIRHTLWWTGPSWLMDEPNTWMKIPVPENELEKRKQKLVVNVAIIQPRTIERFSSWNRAIRVISYCKRWRNHIKGPLQLEELEETKRDFIKECQTESFRKELKRLKKKEPIKRTSNILNLNPFLDGHGIMRVGGRLTKAELPEDTKHPIILPTKHYVTKLIIRQIHLETCHGGPQLMTTLLRKQFWIIQCKRMTNNEYKSCVICKRQVGKVSDQLMGQLPEGRVNLERAFLHTGVDYTGEVEVRSSRLRNAKSEKAYIALFICFATKRFIARRGLVSDMYSDNGGNFVKTASDLDRELINLRNMELAEHAATKGTKWHFIPPAAPTFGGLWERNIKSMKTHLKAVLGTTRLTFEEYSTVLCQIEACLNSRPLCPLTEDPDNLNVLTPGHFLIGDALLAVPQRSLIENTANKLHRWRFLQLVQQHFWKRWSTEYLTQLQQRYKWKTTETNIKEGDLVLIKEDDVPPRKWVMGKIIEIHPGKDGLVRAASIKTETGQTKKGIQKICPLLAREDSEPVEEQQMSSKKKLDKKTKESKYITTNTRVLRPRPIRTGLWIALITIIFLFGGAFGAPIMKKLPITITEFEHQPGIYFEDLGRAAVIKTEWHMYLHFDLKGYWLELNTLQGQLKRLRDICHSETNHINMHCNSVCTQFNRKLNYIMDRNELLKTNGENRQKRSAPLGVIGWIQHELFGVMDEERAAQMQDDIEKVYISEDHMKQLLRNQTSIAEITIDLMKSTEAEINENYVKIKAAMEDLANGTVTSKKREEFIGWAMYIGNVLHKFEGVQSDLINALTDLHQGHVNSHLFTPDLFHEQLTIIYNNLPAGSTVPGSPQDDLKSLYKLLRGKAKVMKEMIIFDMIMPLTSTAEYQIFREIAVPTLQGNHMISIVPNSNYLMITLERNNFYQLDNHEYRTCLQMKTKSICGIRHPIYNIQSNQSRCERDLLARRTTFSEFCQFKISPEADVWIQLQQRNRWIYGLRKELTLNVICDREVFAVKAKGTGLIEITPGCEIIQPEMTITAEAHKQSEGNYNFNPTLNLSSAAVKTEVQVFNLTLDHTQQLQKIHNQLQEVRDQTQVEQYHHFSHYTINSGIIIIVIIVAVFMWIMRSKIRTIYDTTMTSTGYVTDRIWRQWRIHHQRSVSSGVRRPLRSSDDIRQVERRPSHSGRGEDVQYGHRTA